MLAFIEHPLWTKWPVVLSIILAVATLNFFTVYDPIWSPPDSLQASWFEAARAPVALVLGTALDFAFGRIFRIPVRWNFLWRLHIVLMAFVIPFMLMEFNLESFHATYAYSPQLMLIHVGAWLTIWSMAIWQKYRPETGTFRVVAFSILIVSLFSFVAMRTNSRVTPRLLAAQPWSNLELKRVRLFYTGTEPGSYADAKIKAQHVQLMLGRVEKTLQSQPVTEKVNVFIFPDYESFRKFNNDDASEFVGMAGLRGILLYDDEWEAMRSITAHELSHLVLGQDAGVNICPLIDEGTAVWVENKIAPSEEAREIVKQPLSTATLASENVFYTPGDFDTTYSHYCHAGWLAKFTIEKHGLRKWKELIDATSAGFLKRRYESNYDAEKRFQTGFVSIYDYQVQ